MAQTQDTTAAEITAAYESMVALGEAGATAALAAELRKDFERRTGAFGPEDPWFEARSRAFWDGAVADARYAALAAQALSTEIRGLAERMPRAHRGFFCVEDVDEDGGVLVDVWSGAELRIRHLDETQALTLEHAEGALDARVTAGTVGPHLFVLPGAYCHPADALDPALDVLAAARERGFTTDQALDALLRMDLVLRTSSRVKASFAYRAQNLDLVPPEESSLRDVGSRRKITSRR